VHPGSVDINLSLPKTPLKNSSIRFERLEPNNCVPEKPVAPEAQQCEPQYRHLFYLAHPSDAQYRTDIPAYYITAVDKETLGNIHLGTSKLRLRKMEFETLLSSKQTASDRPLFDEAGKASTLFTCDRRN
jgi:hypothetical protein